MHFSTFNLLVNVLKWGIIKVAPYFTVCTLCSYTVLMEGERCVLDRLEEEAKRERTKDLLADGQSFDVVSQITVIPCSRGSTCLRPESGDTSQFDINGICTRFNDSRDSKYTLYVPLNAWERTSYTT